MQHLAGRGSPNRSLRLSPYWFSSILFPPHWSYKGLRLEPLAPVGGHGRRGLPGLNVHWGISVLHPMRGLALAAILGMAAHAQAQSPAHAQAQSPQAQSPAQTQLNALTGAPAGTRCFKSVKLAQEFATRYVASGICPQLRPMDPGQFQRALEVQKAVDRDFAGEACQVQFSLMMRAGREWLQKDPAGSCAETVRKLSGLKGTNAFRGLVR